MKIGRMRERESVCDRVWEKKVQGKAYSDACHSKWSALMPGDQVLVCAFAEQNKLFEPQPSTVVSREIEGVVVE